MRNRDDARKAILSSIRQSLAASVPLDRAREAVEHRSDRPSTGIPLPIAPTNPGAPPPVEEIPATPAARFCAQLQAVGGRWAVAASVAEAARMARTILDELEVRRVALSDAADVRAIMGGEGEEAREFLPEPTQAEIFDADAGVSCAQWGVAETGTLILQSSEERHRMVSLVPPIHIALLRRERICDRLDEAMRHLRTEGGDLESRAITFITGPSRTADIEQMLVVGVHGPQILVVIIIDDAEPLS